MINSDNVIRAGLTPKYKDVSTFFSMQNFRPAGEIDYNMSVSLLDYCDNIKKYKTGFKEFEVCYVKLTDQFQEVSFKSKSYLLVSVFEGTASCQFNDNTKMMTKYDNFFIQAGQVVTIRREC